jgi:hypothetical protein
MAEKCVMSFYPCHGSVAVSFPCRRCRSFVFFPFPSRVRWITSLFKLFFYFQILFSSLGKGKFDPCMRVTMIFASTHGARSLFPCRKKVQFSMYQQQKKNCFIISPKYSCHRKHNKSEQTTLTLGRKQV